MTLPNPVNGTAVLIKLTRNCNKARFLFKSGPALVWSASVCKLDPERWLVWQNNPNHSIRGFSFHGCCPRKFWTGKPQRLLNFLPELLCFSWLRCLPHQLTVLHSIQTPFSFFLSKIVTTMTINSLEEVVMRISNTTRDTGKSILPVSEMTLLIFLRFYWEMVFFFFGRFIFLSCLPWLEMSHAVLWKEK